MDTEQMEGHQLAHTLGDLQAKRPDVAEYTTGYSNYENLFRSHEAAMHRISELEAAVGSLSPYGL